MWGNVMAFISHVRKSLAHWRRSLSTQDRVVIVTGGAKGIGEGITNAFANDGAKVICVDTDCKAGDSITKAFASRLTKQSNHGTNDRSGSIEYHNVDISQSDACKELVRTVIARHGRVDVLVNNAGIQPPESCVALHLLDEHWWDKILAVNLNAVYYLSKHVLPIMISQHKRLLADTAAASSPATSPGSTSGGVVINMGSIQGLQSQKGVPAYAAAKGAVLSLTRQMAMDYGVYGIRVLAVNPGTIATPLVDGLLKMGGSDYKIAGAPYPLEGRVGQSEERLGFSE